MTDIQNRDDITLLVERFYSKVVEDETIGPIFTNVLHFKWETHIPVIVSFWETLLLDKISYTGNPMLKHIELNEQFPLQGQHFQQWLFLWDQTVNENFMGQVAQNAVTKAKSIAGIMQLKINQVK
jgi:hemoglobin